MKVNESQYLNEWKLEMIKTLKRIEPDWDEHKIDKELNKMIKENFINPKVTLDNNYTHERKDASLLSVFDWIIDTNPIIAGNGTFFKNQNIAKNPTAVMLKSMQLERKDIKNNMFTFDPSTYEYEDADRGQSNKKTNMNAYYGASGLKSSLFYSKWAGPSITLSAQSVISTTMWTFEYAIGDNLYFIDLNEFFYWCNLVLDSMVDVDPWLNPISKNVLLERFKSHFIEYDLRYDEIIDKFVDGLSGEERSYLYYKNNLYNFFKDHSNVADIYRSIFVKIPTEDDFKQDSKYLELMEISDDVERCKKIKKYMDIERFLDPNTLPSRVVGEISLIKDYIMKYIYVAYLPFDRIARLKTKERNVVVVVDTDSNMLNLGGWVDYCDEYIINSRCPTRPYEENVFIMINTLTYTLTTMVTNILGIYSTASNIPSNYHKEFSMKNEFLFKRLLVSKKKKRYIASIVLREGNRFNPYKTEIKGHDFKKSSASEMISKYYEKICVNRLLGDFVDIVGLLGDVRDLKNIIESDLRNGKTYHLPLISVKEMGAYKKPMSQQSVRATYAWNMLYPDDIIDVPNKVSILKLNIFEPKDIEPLQRFDIDMYNNIINKIFKNPDKDISSKGLQVMAIPGNKDIPDWMKDYIDYSTVKNNIITQFGSVLSTINVESQPVGKTDIKKGKNRKTREFSNLIRI